jgi:hypothetical protein
VPHERNLWNWLREGVKSMVADRSLHICRIENTVSSGYPDVEGCMNGESFHIELKGCDRPVRGGSYIHIGLSSVQALWLKRRWDAGGSCFVLIRVGVGRGIKRYLIRGDRAMELLSPMTEKGLLRRSVITPDSDPAWIVNVAAGFRRPYNRIKGWG